MNARLTIKEATKKGRKHYVIRAFTGFWLTRSKKKALKILKENKKAFDVILSQSKNQKYYHNRVNIIAEK